ncbi:bifunctional diguanylate cyclase/phosphodiesterase [Aureimonas sp. ME7]|uniref:putative bifunctional diguanylate cyclase/phosphodiesterase n=1 Tax=Aureimonas sp. ME7 TaxID=2744252 RepID=UPI0015F56D94|nr:bifunctional diguanylate cyclase/phosphodiesterase [Aureimonas sp. ME7]
MDRVISLWNDGRDLLHGAPRTVLSLAGAWALAASLGATVQPWLLAPIGLAGAVALVVLARLARRLRALEGDLSQLTADQEALIHRHVLDDITGVMTRRAFLEAVSARLSARSSDEALAFFALDMDHLKPLNDSFGHRAGDFALSYIAQCIDQSFPGALIGRLGGDEFAFVLPCANERVALRLGRDFCCELNRPVMTGGRPLTLSASLGVVMVPERTVYLSEAMQFADIALYAAKRAGRNQIAAFDEEMMRDLKQRRLIERELRAAILLNELDIHYQPITGHDGRTISVEALLRWQSPSRGNISPAVFIPIAESTALIDQLGEWVLRRALSDARELPDLNISVNVSASQLRRDDVVDMVARVLRETGHPPRQLTLELTESVAIQATPDICRRLQALRDMGILVSLDDFGTGFSGFDYLRHLPVDSIKIDRSYIAKLGESDTDNVLVSALASVAGAMRLSVVAEGIENESQLLLAKAAGCTLFQGYFMARPMPKAAIVQRYRTEHARNQQETVSA